MTIMRITYTILMFLACLSVHAQRALDTSVSDTTVKERTLVDLLITETDTFFIYQLDQIIISDFTSDKEREEYLKLVRMVKKVLPYAKLAAFRLQMLEDNLNQIKTKRQKKKYIKETQAQIIDEFIEQLQALHIEEGKLLLKLIHRETGSTTYEILKQYRGSATTFYWAIVAQTYDSSIKVEYDPIKDYWIEYIIKSYNLE